MITRPSRLYEAKYTIMLGGNFKSLNIDIRWNQISMASGPPLSLKFGGTNRWNLSRSLLSCSLDRDWCHLEQCDLSSSSSVSSRCILLWCHPHYKLWTASLDRSTRLTLNRALLFQGCLRSSASSLVLPVLPCSRGVLLVTSFSIFVHGSHSFSSVQ